MSMSPSEQQRERKQEQRDETANQIRGGDVSSGSPSSFKKFESFVHHWIIISPFILNVMLSLNGEAL
jgi:hypothetical protein